MSLSEHFSKGYWNKENFLLIKCVRQNSGMIVLCLRLYTPLLLLPAREPRRRWNYVDRDNEVRFSGEKGKWRGAPIRRFVCPIISTVVWRAAVSTTEMIQMMLRLLLRRNFHFWRQSHTHYVNLKYDAKSTANTDGFKFQSSCQNIHFMRSVHIQYVTQPAAVGCSFFHIETWVEAPNTKIILFG